MGNKNIFADITYQRARKEMMKYEEKPKPKKSSDYVPAIRTSSGVRFGYYKGHRWGRYY